MKKVSSDKKSVDKLIENLWYEAVEKFPYADLKFTGNTKGEFDGYDENDAVYYAAEVDFTVEALADRNVKGAGLIMIATDSHGILVMTGCFDNVWIEEFDMLGFPGLDMIYKPANKIWELAEIKDY